MAHQMSGGRVVPELKETGPAALDSSERVFGTGSVPRGRPRARDAVLPACSASCVGFPDPAAGPISCAACMAAPTTPVATSPHGLLIRARKSGWLLYTKKGTCGTGRSSHAWFGGCATASDRWARTFFRTARLFVGASLAFCACLCVN